jgi:hypothetical protein
VQLLLPNGGELDERVWQQYCDKLRLRKGRPLKREVGAAARPRGLRRRRARADGAPAARAGDAAVLREAARL